MINTEEYIKSCKLVHGDEYDYSKTIYKHSFEKVIIICKIHGEFEIVSNRHKLPNGKCRLCQKKSRKNKLEYINFLNKIHNFDYEYKIDQEFHSHKKINILCRIHGEFSVRLSAHISGQGCKKCNIDNERMIENEKTIERINCTNFITGNFYNDTSYSYKFLCTKHGEYYKSPQLIRGGFYNCPKCSANSIKSLKFYQEYIYKKTDGNIALSATDEFLIQNKKYNFICSIHGKFKRRLDFILKHPYCKKCGTNAKMTGGQFIERANNVHDFTFDYSKVLYIDYNSNVEIICKKHGSFLQSPNVHLSGSGCPKCKSSTGEKLIRKILNALEIKHTEQKKFNDCRNILPLKFDFYLENYNLVIEYNGIQHYEPIRWHKNDTIDEMNRRFEYIKNNDNLKRKYCELNGINYLEISYKDKNCAKDIILDSIGGINETY